MARIPKASAKNRPEYAAFESALKKVLSVSHAEIKAKIEKEKRKKVKPSASREVGD